jgi:hypothetical protein
VVAWLPLVFGLAPPDGRAVFAEYCSIPYCHGADGGEGRAPMLRGRSWHERDLRRIIADGVPDTSMPPFGNRLSPEELASLIDFVRSISLEMDSSEGDMVRTSERAPWDLASGRALFHEGSCAHCHRFGRADRAGPDLSRAAEKRPFEILRDIVEPGAENSGGKGFVQVETKGGESFSAVREEDRETEVRVHDLSTSPPVLRRIAKAEIVRVEPLAGSAMPAELWKNFDARQLRDLVFYVRTKGAVGNTVPEVATRPVDIWSDGTRLSGDLFYPTGRTDKLPAIVMSHGWGGVRSHLNEAYASYFAAEGFVVLTFDYRGWGESDGRLVMLDGRPTEVREVVDPWDQIEDIVSALHFIEGEELVDPERIGYWGSSYSGGHAVWVAAHDRRVKAIVAQVPAMDSTEFVAAMDGGLEDAHGQEIRRARGEIRPVPLDAPPLGELQGHPYASRMASYSPRSVADRVRVPTLILDAGNEELFDIHEHGQRVYEMVKGNAPAKYHVFPGITHYGIYREKRPEAIALAVAWFREHLGEKPGESP